MKKRSCKRTKEEATMHERAVKIRKMTDQQLIAYVDEAEERGRRQGVKIFMCSILSKKYRG